MPNDPSRVVVQTGATSSSTRVYHRDFPEIRADGEDPHTAAAHLAGQLERALDSALTNWRRDTINEAISDVRAFVDSTR